MEQELKVGDEVFLEQGWEDSNGNIRDCQATIKRILKDGRLKFCDVVLVDQELPERKRNALEKKICVFLNQCTWFASDGNVEKI